MVLQETVESILQRLAEGAPLVGLLAGTAIGIYVRRVKRGIICGLLPGLLFCGVYGMWRLFNAITNALGLQSVANLAVELVLFAIIGGLTGIAAARVFIVLKRT